MSAWDHKSLPPGLYKEVHAATLELGDHRLTYGIEFPDIGDQLIYRIKQQPSSYGNVPISPIDLE